MFNYFFYYTSRAGPHIVMCMPSKMNPNTDTNTDTKKFIKYFENTYVKLDANKEDKLIFILGDFNINPIDKLIFILGDFNINQIGGFLAHAIRLSAITLEPFHLGSPNFLTSLFYSLDTLWRNFR